MDTAVQCLSQGEDPRPGLPQLRGQLSVDRRGHAEMGRFRTRAGGEQPRASSHGGAQRRRISGDGAVRAPRSSAAHRNREDRRVRPDPVLAQSDLAAGWRASVRTGPRDRRLRTRARARASRHRLTAEELTEIRPGLVHVELSLFGPKGPWSGRTGFDQNAGGVSGIFAREGTLENPALTEIFVVNDYAMAWLSFLGVAAALRRRAEEGGSYRVRLSLARLSMWLLQLGIFDKAYAHQVGHSPGDHAFLDPDTFTAETPLGLYQGVTDQVQMSRTPGEYRTPLVPRGSSRPEWLERA